MNGSSRENRRQGVKESADGRRENDRQGVGESAEGREAETKIEATKGRTESMGR